MERSTDPTHVRVGISVGTPEDAISAARLLATFHEVMARMLNLLRLAIVALPILVQCFFVHTVDFGSWLLRLVTLYVLIGGACFIVVPEQLYNGMGLANLRWLFEKFYPEIALANGTVADPAEHATEVVLAGRNVNELHGLKVKVRWHGTNRYLCITNDGWAVTGDEGFAAVLMLQRVFAKDKKVPDTYHFRIDEPDATWHQAWLSFQPINHLRFGGWVGAFKDPQKAAPYKFIVDSACQPGTFKLLCASLGALPPPQRSVTGFYMAEQLCGRQLYVGHAPDRGAALLELVPAP